MAGDLKGLSRPQIRLLFDAGTATGLTDGQLLERFATRRDDGSELAFAVLVERHGPMVLRACRGILRDEHEAMDAFQATFFVLARKGGSLWVRDSLGPWLHRVACHAAGRARSTAARQRATERRAAEMAVARHGNDERDGLASLIHEEVDRLPERYRAAIVLCDLEGRTFEEAARHLGCPVGTVASRLSRGRQRLREQLGRHGLAPQASQPAGALNWRGNREPVPPELVGSTACAAARFVSNAAVTQGAATSLALGVLRSMSMIHWWKVAFVLFAVGASTSGVVALVGRDGTVAKARADDTPKAADGSAVTEVKPGKLSVVVEEMGRLEAARSSDVFCMVEGQVTIIFLLPEGTRVTKGQLVCELDSSRLRGELTTQQAAVEKAEAALENAKLAREVAELAMQEYVEGIYPANFRAASRALASAQSSVASAEERVKRTQATRERLNTMLAGQGGPKTPADLVATLDVDDRLAAAERALDRGRRTLESARAKREVLEKFTKDKTVKQLRVTVETARPVELARQASCESERAKEAKLRRQIASCKILAPASGTVIYANDSTRVGMQSGVQIAAGVTIRERQKIFSVTDLEGPLRVVAKVSEAWVDQVSPGLTARVKVDAFPDEILLGVVDAVAPLPDPTTTFSSDLKVYTTFVTLSKRAPGLRPGMTGRVEILVAALDNVLSVPVEAVVWYDGKDHLAVRTPEGGFDWHEVTLGRTDGKVVEIKEGLKSGETVAVAAAPLLSEEQKRKMALAPPKLPSPARLPTAKGKASRIPPALRTKLQAIAPEDRIKLREASAPDREALLKKAGLTDDEIRQFNQLRQQPDGPR